MVVLPAVLTCLQSEEVKQFMPWVVLVMVSTNCTPQTSNIDSADIVVYFLITKAMKDQISVFYPVGLSLFLFAKDLDCCHRCTGRHVHLFC